MHSSDCTLALDEFPPILGDYCRSVYFTSIKIQQNNGTTERGKRDQNMFIINTAEQCTPYIYCITGSVMGNGVGHCTAYLDRYFERTVYGEAVPVQVQVN